jgi:hypothetical protein
VTEPGSSRVLFFDDDLRGAQLEITRRQQDLQTLRVRYEEPPIVDNDAAARALADQNLNFARANSLLNQGRTLVALDETGRFLTELQPTHSFAVAAAFWETHPDAQPASLCGREQDLLAASFSDIGWEWLKEEAVESLGSPPPNDPISALGVPGRDDSGDLVAPPHVRDPGGWMVQVVEQLPPWRPQPQQVTLGTRAGHDAAKKLEPRASRWVRWLVWGWPSPDDRGREWDMPIGHRGDRFCLEGALPAEGVELVKAGARWRISTQPPCRCSRCRSGLLRCSAENTESLRCPPGTPQRSPPGKAWPRGRRTVASGSSTFPGATVTFEGLRAPLRHDARGGAPRFVSDPARGRHDH